MMIKNKLIFILSIITILFFTIMALAIWYSKRMKNADTFNVITCCSDGLVY